MKPVINFKSEGIQVNFIVKEKYTKILGNSGTGKTFFCNSLRDNLKIADVLGIYPVTDADTKENIPTIVVDLNSLEPDIVKNRENTLIVIDDADIILKEHRSIINDILNNSSNSYIFMCRSTIPNLPIYTSEMAVIREYNNELRVEYIC